MIEDKLHHFPFEKIVQLASIEEKTTYGMSMPAHTSDHTRRHRLPLIYISNFHKWMRGNKRQRTINKSRGGEIRRRITSL